MEYNLTTAIDQMIRNEEPGINYIYSKTYNYVYLRAKNILKRESDIQQLMQDVYLKMLESSEEIKEDNLYEWLGKTAYRLGCKSYRKKKAREAAFLEIEKNELTSRKVTNPESTVDVIGKSLEELPDLYQATFYAFYYDCMTVEEIADVMDCTTGVIINRLNYTRKYMIKALENFEEETKAKVAFSVEAVCMALRKWSVDHCLGMTLAQNVYSDICKAVKLQAGSIRLEGKEFAGVKNTVVYHKTDDFSFLERQFEAYGKTDPVDKKTLKAGAAIATLVVVLILAVILFSCAGGDKDKKKDDSNPVKVENQAGGKEEEEQNQTEENVSEEVDNDDEDGANDEETTNDEEQTTDSEYILPDSDTRELTRADLEGLTKEQLRLARNEIFARHGMIFGPDDLEAYFSSKSWYSPTVPTSEFYDRVEMSLIEEANIVLIQEVESER